jgi:hypothetical protein
MATDYFMRMNWSSVGGCCAVSVFCKFSAVSFWYLCRLVVLVFAASVGVFGPGARSAVYNVIETLEKLYVGYKGPVDYAVWVLSIGVSAVTGTFAIYKSWYYAEFSLPRRLTSLIDRRNALLWSARPALLAAANDAASDYQGSVPVFYFYPIHKLLRDIGFGRPRYLGNELSEAIDENTRDLAAVRSRMKELENEIVTGHILRGSVLAAEATLVSRQSEARVTKNRQALEEFKAALNLIEDDVDALMLAAKQSEIVGDDGSALAYVSKMILAARNQELPMRQAQGFRLKAQILVKSDWNEARRNIVSGLDVLNGMVETSQEKTQELARAQLLLGEVQTKRERFTASRLAFNRARALLPQITQQVREDVRKALELAETALMAAQQDKEEPED